MRPAAPPDPAASSWMTLPLIPSAANLPFAGDPDVVPIPQVATDRVTRDAQPAAPSKPTQSIFAMHLVNGEHYSGAERVQDLLAKQLPQFGCEVGFVCVKPRKFPSARETKTAPLVEMPM